MMKVKIKPIIDRNCIDIVVKLALGIDQLNKENRAQDKAEVDLLIENRGDIIKLRACKAIKNVSNIIKVDPDIIILDLPVRIKQRSDVKEVKIFNDLERVIKNKYDVIVKLTDGNGAEQEKSIYGMILGSNDLSDKEILQQLFRHNDQCNIRIDTVLSDIKQESVKEDAVLMGDAVAGGYI